ncbi:glycosyltransferase family 2 protein [Cedecea davisae]|uniref:Glycosyltransferase family 2 protein n=2 Tax=Cedecea davisae TaxID=158484 RepID=A0ABS6DIN1_9ENTR|nr:glycosyltransferase family 2 protein [Cedecea davisae]MBU4687918.1 glycosyltransferase family 2 protein [Cedecea davisae]
MLHIIIVSHNHDDYIIALINMIHKQQGEGFIIYVKDNVNSKYLQDFCTVKNITYLRSDVRVGFARNNNLVVNYIRETRKVSDNDYFLFVNPDVLMGLNVIDEINKAVEKHNYDMFTIDLYKNLDMSVRDPSVRKFPKLSNFLTSYILGFNNSIIDRSDISKPLHVDWCAGSFLGVKAEVFEKLKGFDENFFMYCEDLDLCMRARQSGFTLYYLPEIKAIHFCQNENRKLISKNFIWHLKSIAYIYWKRVCTGLLAKKNFNLSDKNG